MSLNKAPENKSDNESENKYDENKSKNESDNECHCNNTNNDKSIHIENIINDIVTKYKSQNKDITDGMADNIVDHISNHIIEYFSDIIADIIAKYKPKNQYTIEETHAIITTHINDFITKYITDSDINDLTKPIINWKPFKKAVVIDEEIKRLDRKIVIETIRHPTKKNPNRNTYVIKSQMLCNHLDIKGRKIEKVNKQKLLQLKYESIADMCMVPLEKVNEVLKLDIKPSSEYRKRVKHQKNCVSNYNYEKENKKRRKKKQKKKKHKKQDIIVEIEDEKHLLRIKTMFK